MNEFSEELKRFVEESNWIFAKTYATTWPHEYLVEEKVDRTLFSLLADHIDHFGYESEFYDTKQTYFDYDGNTYWHMENIINRCPEGETYRRRKAEGRLPEDVKH